MTDPNAVPYDTSYAGGLALLLLFAALVFAGWFFGRLHEAMVEMRQEQADEAAFNYASVHGRLPQPEIKTVYVDLETGLMLDKQDH